MDSLVGSGSILKCCIGTSKVGVPFHRHLATADPKHVHDAGRNYERQRYTQPGAGCVGCYRLESYGDVCT